MSNLLSYYYFLCHSYTKPRFMSLRWLPNCLMTAHTTQNCLSFINKSNLFLPFASDTKLIGPRTWVNPQIFLNFSYQQTLKKASMRNIIHKKTANRKGVQKNNQMKQVKNDINIYVVPWYMKGRWPKNEETDHSDK